MLHANGQIPESWTLGEGLLTAALYYACSMPGHSLKKPPAFLPSSARTETARPLQHRVQQSRHR